jgi:hypothetical protein
MQHTVVRPEAYLLSTVLARVKMLSDVLFGVGKACDIKLSVLPDYYEHHDSMTSSRVLVCGFLFALDSRVVPDIVSIPSLLSMLSATACHILHIYTFNTLQGWDVLVSLVERSFKVYCQAGI